MKFISIICILLAISILTCSFLKKNLIKKTEIDTLDSKFSKRKVVDRIEEKKLQEINNYTSEL